jgi:hypothetical protein
MVVEYGQFLFDPAKRAKNKNSAVERFLNEFRWCILVSMHVRIFPAKGSQNIA